MDRTLVRIAWAFDWFGIFALACSALGLGLMFWFVEDALGGTLLLGSFRWLGIAIVALWSARVCELSAVALSGQDRYAHMSLAIRGNTSEGEPELGTIGSNLRRAA